MRSLPIWCGLSVALALMAWLLVPKEMTNDQLPQFKLVIIFRQRRGQRQLSAKKWATP
jgi:hypothetical protein